MFAAFGLEILWNKPGQQATIFVEITDATLQAIPGILDPGQDGYHDTSPATSTNGVDPMGICDGDPGVCGLTVIRADTRTYQEIPGRARSPRYKRSHHKSVLPEAPRAVLSCHS